MFTLVLAEIIMLDGLTVVYRSNVDLYFYVMGSQFENEVCKILFLSILFMRWAMLHKQMDYFQTI